MSKNTTKQEKLNLKNDIIFKAFFSRKGNEKYLKDFLNAILKIEIKDIKIQEEVNLEQLSTKEKGGRLDIQATLNDGMIVNIEMQMNDLENIEQRNDIYEAKTISRHFPRGEDYENAKEVIAIYILNYNLFGFDEYILDTVKVLNKHRNYQVNCISKEYYIQLPKFREIDADMDDKLNQWLAVIDDMDRGKIEMAKSKNKIIEEADFEIKYYTASEEARYLADMRDLWESDRVSELNSAKRKAIKEGREEGRKEGIKEGIKEGETKKQIEIAKKLLEMNESIDKIIKITGLPKEEIQKLKKIL